MTKQKKILKTQKDQDFNPNEIKRPYQKVTEQKRNKLIKLRVDKQFTIKRASTTARINNSNAKAILRKSLRQEKINQPEKKTQNFQVCKVEEQEIESKEEQPFIDTHQQFLVHQLTFQPYLFPSPILFSPYFP